MKKKILATVTAILAAIAIAGITIGIFNIYKRDTTAENISFPDKLGVWWWDNRIDDTYLNFAYEQGVTDIYYYASSFTQKISDFIEKADKKNIKVYWLCGKYEWIEDNAALYAKIEEYRNFQQQSEHKFAGIHFDIEPHQHPDFESDRQRLITDYVRLTFSLSEIYQDIHIEYDIPFWLHDEITVNGIKKPAYAFVIDNADDVTVMSYRDSAEAIYDCAREETEYATSVGKVIDFGVETSENEDDIVTFYEEGAEFMQSQLSELRKIIPDNCGISVHHIKSWKELKQR